MHLGAGLVYTFIMKYNYHTHTFRCSHASGIERNYIERAIANGIKKMGFSDHIPFMHKDGAEKYYRVKKKDVLDYFETLKALREEYKDKIEIYIGFETEYYPTYFDEMISYALDMGAEYFILGQHQSGSDRADDPNGVNAYFCFDENDNEEELTRYINDLISAVKSGYISYAAHPDGYKFSGNVDFYKKEYARFLKVCKELNVPVELNLLGIRTNRHYPRPELWEIVGEIGTPVVFGMDAHDEPAAYDSASLIIANEMVKKYNLNFISDYTPKIITKK